MPVKDTSAANHAINDHSKVIDRIWTYLIVNAPVTRREIATALRIDTATVSGLITPMLKSGDIHETGKRECRVTGRTVTQLDYRPVQGDMWDAAA